MNYERELLGRLIEKYEKSRAYTTGVFSKRIALAADREAWIQEHMEQPDEKRLFLGTLEALKRDGLIDYSWEKYEEGNLVKKIWLTPDEAMIRACYGRLGLVPEREKSDELLALIEKYRCKLEAGTSISHFLKTYMADLEERHQIRQPFTEDDSLNEDLLKCLVYMEQNRGEQMERLMSSGLYGDSKRFERFVKPKALTVLRRIKKEEDEDIPEDEELLREKGIVRWPEILEFTGRLTVRLQDGEIVDYRTQKYGAYINGETVKRIAEVCPEGIRRVLFIENKANYVWYIAHERADDELVILHGGCYSPVKGQWFRKVYDGCRGQSAGVRYCHWSDIDVGGFRIFRRLQKNIVPELEPYRMDADTLEAFRNDAMEIGSESYLRTLGALLRESEYGMFHEVIGRMLRYRIRLEQEKLIV